MAMAVALLSVPLAVPGDRERLPTWITRRPAEAEAAWTRLAAIGDTPATDAYEAVRSLVSRDNEMGVREQAPALLAIPEVLQARGVLVDPERAPFLVQRTDGERLTIVLHPLAAL